MTTHDGTYQTEDWDDDWDDPEQEEEPTAAPPNPDDVPIEPDPEDPVTVPEKFYTVQRTYTVGDRDIERGTKVQVKCQNCCLWEAELPAYGDVAFCRPGVRTAVQVGDEELQWRMSPDRHSCQDRFLPGDAQDVLQHLQTKDPHRLKLLLMTFSTVKHLVKLNDRLERYCDRNGVADADRAIDAAFSFMLDFNSTEQAAYVRPVVQHVYDQLAAQIKPAKRKTPRHKKPRPGDRVSWLRAPEADDRVEGLIRVIDSRNKVVEVWVTGTDAMTLKPAVAQEWRQANPDADTQAFSIQIRYDNELWKQLAPQRVEAVPTFDVQS